MTRRLVVSYLTVTVFFLLVLEIPLAVVFQRSERDDLVARVRQDALVVALAAKDKLDGEPSASTQLDRQIANYQTSTGGRTVVVDAKGTTVSSTSGVVGNVATQPDMVAALAGHSATSWRNSESPESEVLDVSVPVMDAGQVIGAVRVTFPASAVTDRIHRADLILVTVALIVLVIVSILSLLIARSVTKPLQAVENAAARLGRGDLFARAPVAGPPEVRVLAQVLNETATRLETLIGSQRAFVADASHQLRTPLAALRLRLENLEADLTGNASDDLQGAVAEVMRLSRLVDGLLALARAEREPAAPEPVDTAAIATNRCDAWSPLAEERGLTLTGALRPGTRALVTPGHLEQVLDNLIANAIEAAPAGTAITVNVEARGAHVSLSVVDHGPGMTAEERTHAFDRFWRPGDRPAGLGGSGLGLAIVHQLVLADGGQVDLTETAGGGLTVVLRLRHARGDADAGRAEAPAGPASAATPAHWASTVPATKEVRQ